MHCFIPQRGRCGGAHGALLGLLALRWSLLPGATHAAEARERVFERFYRGEHTATPGSGLGLAIVREVARAFGAEVSLSGHADGNTGLRVTVRFHAPGPHEADEAAAPAVG